MENFDFDEFLADVIFKAERMPLITSESYPFLICIGKYMISLPNLLLAAIEVAKEKDNAK